MSRDWRCLIGWHDWREVEMPDHDKCAECTRCGKRDWRRLLTHTSSKWRGGDPRLPTRSEGQATAGRGDNLGAVAAMAASGRPGYAFLQGGRGEALVTAGPSN
jgi:hypothetical protein